MFVDSWTAFLAITSLTYLLAYSDNIRWRAQSHLQQKYRYNMVGPMIGYGEPAMNQICTRKPHFVRIQHHFCPALTLNYMPVYKTVLNRRFKKNIFVVLQ